MTFTLDTKALAAGLKPMAKIHANWRRDTAGDTSTRAQAGIERMHTEQKILRFDLPTFAAR